VGRLRFLNLYFGFLPILSAFLGEFLQLICNNII
jgi:hypothetical protein